ncbi:MAG TPA: molybdopterin cofactor-binding domain-containing protein, partial [Acidimicrobiales bacterium]|nr:molybdopterin cofactor-binding domain-containing protein [Acidimicrobiales bacterium]
MTDAAAGTTRYSGSRVHRVEDPRLLTGRGTFVDDVVRPGMLHACFVRSPFARARIGEIDLADALAAPGVRAIFTAADLNPGVHELWFSMQGAASPSTPLPPLAEGEVRFVGDPVALVVADDRYLAEDAADLVVVHYDPLPPVVDYEVAETLGEAVHADHPDNVVGRLAGGTPDKVDEALASAAHVLTRTIRQQAYAAVPIETRGLVVEWDAPSEQLTIWAATQAPHEVRSVCSRLLDLPEHRIRVVMR